MFDQNKDEETQELPLELQEMFARILGGAIMGVSMSAQPHRTFQDLMSHFQEKNLDTSLLIGIEGSSARCSEGKHVDGVAVSVPKREILEKAFEGSDNAPYDILAITAFDGHDEDYHHAFMTVDQAKRLVNAIGTAIAFVENQER